MFVALDRRYSFLLNKTNIIHPLTGRLAQW
jgi:hypothetical protein